MKKELPIAYQATMGTLSLGSLITLSILGLDLLWALVILTALLLIQNHLRKKGYHPNKIYQLRKKQEAENYANE